MTATRPARTPTSRSDDLRRLSREEFTALVSANLGRSAPDDLWDRLTAPRVAPRTLKNLTALYQGICTQLAERAARKDAAAGTADGDAELRAWEAWRPSALGLRRLLEERIAQTRPAVPAASKRRTPMTPGRRIRLVSTVVRLGFAIRQHQAASERAGIEPEPHDTALWQALNVVQVQTADDVMPVADLLDRVTSHPDFTPPDLTTGGR